MTVYLSRRNDARRGGDAALPLAALSLAAALLLAGCQGRSESGNPGSSSGTGLDAPASADSMRGSDVVATVNGAPITEGQLFDALQHYVPQRVPGWPNNPDLAQPSGVSALRNLIISAITVQFAQSSGVPVTSAELDASYNDQLMLQEAKQTLPFESVLADQGYTVDSYKQELLAPKVAQLNVLQKAETIAPGDIQALYNTSKSQYVIPARVHVHRIVSATQQDAQNVYSGIKAGRPMSDFAGVSLAGGDGGNPADNTDIAAWIDANLAKNLFPNIASQIFKAKVGDLLPPVSVQGRWWVIQIIDAKPSQPLPFDQVSDLVRQNLVQQKAATAAQSVQQQIIGAMHSAQIKINPPQYQAVAMQVHMFGIGAPASPSAPVATAPAPPPPVRSSAPGVKKK